MADYKDIILNQLSDAGWEQAEVMQTSQWWGSEIWRIRSVTINWGFELFLSFMTDPHPGWASTRENIWLVNLTATDPCEVAEAPRLGAIPTKQKHLERGFPEFIGVMDRLRREEQTKSS